MSLLASCVFSPLIYANTFSEIMLPRQTLFPLCHTCFAITFSSNLFMKWKCVKLSHVKSEQWKKRRVVAVREQLMRTDPTLSCHILILGKNKKNTRPCPPSSYSWPPVWIWFRCDHPILLLFNVKFLLQQTSKLNLWSLELCDMYM